MKVSRSFGCRQKYDLMLRLESPWSQFCCFPQEKLQVKMGFTGAVKGVCCPSFSVQMFGLRGLFTQV